MVAQKAAFAAYNALEAHEIGTWQVEQSCTATSTSILDHSQRIPRLPVSPSPARHTHTPHTRRGICSAERPCLSDADWCLRSEWRGSASPWHPVAPSPISPPMQAGTIPPSGGASSRATSSAASRTTSDPAAPSVPSRGNPTRYSHRRSCVTNQPGYGNFDIILDQISCFSQVHTTCHALCTMR